MAQLNSVIGAILRDIISAQHEANLYSLSLSESYGKDGKVKDFQLPNVIISDMELDLKYGIVGAIENQEQQNIKYSKFRQFLKELCNEAAKTVITCVVSVVLSSDIKKGSEDKQFFYHLKKEKDINKKFQTFLMRNMQNAFRNNLHESINIESGKIIEDVLLSKLMNVVRKKFISDSDLSNLFDGSLGEKLKEEVDYKAQLALSELLKSMSENISFKRVKAFTQLDVAVTAEELEKMPEEAIHSFKIKFSPNICDIADNEDEIDLDDFVME